MPDERLRKLLDRIYTRVPPVRGEVPPSVGQLPPPPPMPAAALPETRETPAATVVTVRFDTDAGQIQRQLGLPQIEWTDVVPHFPKATARPGQEAVVRLAIAGLHRFDDVVIEAPTGLGKSAIAKTLTKWAQAQGNASYLVAHRNFLLHQYSRDHDDLALIKGMGNYACVLAGHRGTPVNVAPCQTRARFHCPVKEECPYFIARDRALEATQTLTNYDYLYWSGTANEQFAPRDLLVLDEAHSVEGVLMRNFQFAVSDSWVRGLIGKSTPAGLVPRLQATKEPKEKAEILVRLWQLVKRHYDGLCFDTANGRQAPERLPPEDRRRYEGALEQLRFLATELHARPTNWVEGENETGPDGQPALEYKPVTIAPYAPQLLSLGRKRVHLSATILNHDVYLKALGIAKALVIKVGQSPFPAANRPVINLAVARLNRETLKPSLPKIMEAIDDVLDRHADEKGIILPYTNRIHDAIAAAPIRNRARLVTHSKRPEERDSVLTAFMAERTGNRVLVSTYANEGMDFVDEAARFCVIVKTPYPNLGDPQIRARSKADPAWYENETLKSIIQMAGRIVRGPTDRGTVYILDSNATRLLRSNRAVVPEWFAEAYQPGRETAPRTDER